MIKKCPICHENKAKRFCAKRNGDPICSMCCAKERGEACPPCPHFEESSRYAKDKYRKTGKVDALGGRFATLIDEALEDEIDEALKKIESGRESEARPEIERLYRENPDYHVANFAMGILHVKAERPEDAIPYFKRAVEIFPYFTEAHFNLAQCYNRLLNVQDHLRGLQEVVRIGNEKKDYVIHAKKVLREIDSKIRDEHGIDLNTYLELGDMFHRAHDLMLEKKFVEAIGLFEQIVGKSPRHHQSWGNLGICFAMLGRKKDAIHAHDKALEVNPEYAPSLTNRLLAERMEEGVPLRSPDGSEAGVASVNYSVLEYLEHVEKEEPETYDAEQLEKLRKLAGPPFRV